LQTVFDPGKKINARGGKAAEKFSSVLASKGTQTKSIFNNKEISPR
jgi:hypothetical protein